MNVKAQPDLFTPVERAFDGAPVAERRPDRTSGCARLAAFFRVRPGKWIDGQELAQIAGVYGWRTRVSELRRPPYGMGIENRQRRRRRRVISEYRWMPAGDAL